MRNASTRVRIGIACGAILVLGGLAHLVVNMTGVRTSHFEWLLMGVVLVIAVGLPGVGRAHGWRRGLYVGGAVLAVGSVLALVVTPSSAAQSVERGAALIVLLGYSLPWTIRPLRGTMHGGLDAAQFGVGVFIADQLAAFGIGDLILIAWPDLALHNWPLSLVGGLVQEGCLLLVLGMYTLAAPGIVDWPGLRVPARRWTTWRPIVIAALQVEFGVIVFQLLLQLVLGVLHIDLAGIGNATFPEPGDWQPTVPEVLLLSAIFPGLVEELVFRGVIFRAVRASAPLAVAVVISSALFGLGHLSPDMAPANMASVFLDTFVAGSLMALAYQRTGSLYAAILAHVFSDVGPALAVALPHEMTQWVFLVTVELSILGMLPFVFALFRRQRQRWAVSLTDES